MAEADDASLESNAQALIAARARRAAARASVQRALDAMYEEARTLLGRCFTQNDPVTGQPVALVVKIDERLPDDYEQQTPRPPTDTVSRLVIDVLGRSFTLEVNDAGDAVASGDVPNVPLDTVKGIRADGTTTYLVAGDTAADSHDRTDIPFVRVVAQLVDAALLRESRFSTGATVPA
jgi:hypothetical protein